MPQLVAAEAFRVCLEGVGGGNGMEGGRLLYCLAHMYGLPRRYAPMAIAIRKFLFFAVVDILAADEYIRGVLRSVRLLVEYYLSDIRRRRRREMNTWYH